MRSCRYLYVSDMSFKWFSCPQRLGCPHMDLGNMAIDFYWSQDGQTTDIQILISAIRNMGKRHAPRRSPPTQIVPP